MYLHIWNYSSTESLIVAQTNQLWLLTHTVSRNTKAGLLKNRLQPGGGGKICITSGSLGRVQIISAILDTSILCPGKRERSVQRRSLKNISFSRINATNRQNIIPNNTEKQFWRFLNLELLRRHFEVWAKPHIFHFDLRQNGRKTQNHGKHVLGLGRFCLSGMPNKESFA